MNYKHTHTNIVMEASYEQKAIEHKSQNINVFCEITDIN